MDYTRIGGEWSPITFRNAKKLLESTLRKSRSTSLSSVLLCVCVYIYIYNSFKSRFAFFLFVSTFELHRNLTIKNYIHIVSFCCNVDSGDPFRTFCDAIEYLDSAVTAVDEEEDDEAQEEEEDDECSGIVNDNVNVFLTDLFRRGFAFRRLPIRDFRLVLDIPSFSAVVVVVV